ncbi:MAG TPA: 3-keto-5-aminohexanoate cleavage protein [Thermoleophilaceae bacterium]|nr:3-keto-5-aminohexanoate cleavage protein [Thermoleophilaceae bacterium]
MNDTPVVVQAALAGAGLERVEGFPVPETTDAVVKDALAAWDAGAAAIHLRARRPDRSPSTRAEHFAPLVEGIRAGQCDAILNFACGAAEAEDLDCLALGPELASIDCWDEDPEGFAIDRSLPALRDVLARFADCDTAPELRCRHLWHLRTLLHLREEGLLADPLRVQLVVEDGSATAIERVLRMGPLLPADAVWSVAGLGLWQARLNVLCLIAGGHVRTGLEDNVWLVQDVPATNEQLVQRIVRIVDELDRPLATPDEARAILGLAPREAPPAAVDLHLTAG